MSIYSYGRDFKIILRFFMKKEWIPKMELSLPKADKSPTETYTNNVSEVSTNMRTKYGL